MRGQIVSMVIGLLVFCVTESVASPFLVDTVPVPSFFNRDKNDIVFNGADWTPLFSAMAALQEAGDSTRVVSIVHIGDSHLQAGFFTAAVREPLQSRFGNAGRGLVVPLKLTKTNEPRDYSITSSESWNYARCMGQKNSQYAPGVGGVAIVSSSGNIDLTFSLNGNLDDYAGFRTIRLFHAPVDSFPGIISEPLCVLGKFENPYVTRFSWEGLVNSVHLMGESGHTLLPIYGASLESGENGILYHTIGNNGAFYSTYAGVPRFAEQVASLAPQLIVVSLGTNESFSTSLTRDILYPQIDKVVSALRRENPQAFILLTTPAECAQRKVRRVRRRRQVYYSTNSRVEVVCETIREYARDHKLAYWDWYEVAGGKGASTTWCAGGYMAADRTHCTESGYQAQGEMLYRTLMKAYHEYLYGVAQ